MERDLGIVEGHHKPQHPPDTTAEVPDDIYRRFSAAIFKIEEPRAIYQIMVFDMGWNDEIAPVSYQPTAGSCSQALADARR